MELCLEHAKEKKNLSVDQVADLMGVNSKWTLYKWLENGRMPAILIRPFEHACGIALMTDYIASSAQKLLIDIPTGTQASQDELIELQEITTQAIGLLNRFYRGDVDADSVIGGVTAAMGRLAGHRANVMKDQAPELPLFEDAKNGQ